jgi:sirohydrochlorin cobaltochelatase
MSHTKQRNPNPESTDAGDKFRLLLFVHGSRDPRWRAPFERMTAELQEKIGAGRVRLVYMEFAEPTLLDVAGEAARDGVSCLRLLPLFLAGGAHVANDIPEQVDEVIRRHPNLHIEVLPPVGEDPRFAAMLRDIATESAGD